MELSKRCSKCGREINEVAEFEGGARWTWTCHPKRCGASYVASVDRYNAAMVAVADRGDGVIWLGVDL